MATTYGKVTKGTGFDIPAVEDGVYDVQIADVVDGTSKWEGVERPQYIIKFDLEELFNAKGEPVQLAGFIAIPDGVINDGVLNENSNLYAFLKALGYEDEDMEVDPGQWQGQQLRILVENKEIKTGDNKGQVRPRIVKYARKKGGERAAAASATKARTTTTTAPARGQTIEDDQF